VVAGVVGTAAFGQSSAAVFEGARVVIVGDARPPLENASIRRQRRPLRAGGPRRDVKVPAGATRVSLAGKTVMPAIIDTHTHLSQTREMLIDDLAAGLLRRGRSDEPGPGHDGRVFRCASETMPGWRGSSPPAAASPHRNRAARPRRTG
jgi:hypothetical protein